MALFFALIGGGISYLIAKSGDVKPALDGKCKEENMIKAYGQYWKGYFDFGGKTNRRDYWLAVLAWFLIYIIWMFAGNLVIGGFIDIPQMSEVPTYIGYLEAIYGVINVIPMLSMAVRRLNDAGYDWKILLWNLFPFFGQIAVLIFLCKETCVGLVEKCAREGHRWTYDRAKCLETCSVCAATRPKHNFRAVPDRCINKCTICGTETFRPHKNEPTDDPDFVRCKICGQYAVTLHRFTHEEKDALKFAIDIGVKANQNRSLDEVYASCERQVNSLSPALGLVELTALAVTAHQVNQALVQNVQKTQLNAGNINQNMAVVNSLTVAMNLKTAIDKMAVITEKFKNLTGNENAQAMGNASATKKPLASFASYDESYLGYKKGGVCDVCNKGLSGKKAYAVPNDVFYASPEYREYMKSGPFAAITGHRMTDADIDRMRDQDKSPGSAVCEDCIHMFADISAVPNGSSDPKYYERDNMGTRQDNMGQATSYWMIERMQSAVKPQFTLFTMPSYSAGEKAFLSLPFFHKAEDSGKLICDRLMTFGLYEVKSDNKTTGKFEAMISGTDLTLDEFNQAESAFKENGGKRKNSSAPDASVKAEPVVFGDPNQVRFESAQKSPDGKYTYEYYKGASQPDALAFLKTKTVDKQFYYLVVETPEGDFGRDINGIYRSFPQNQNKIHII